MKVGHQQIKIEKLKTQLHRKSTNYVMNRMAKKSITMTQEELNGKQIQI